MTGEISSDRTCSTKCWQPKGSNASFFLACRLVDILDEHYSFSDFVSKLCCALRGTCQKGPSKLLGCKPSEALSLKPTLPRPLFRQTPAAKPHVMMHKRIFRPHFAVGTCCTVLSSHGDDSLFLLSMESQEQTSYCSSAPNASHFEPSLGSNDSAPT